MKNKPSLKKKVFSVKETWTNFLAGLTFSTDWTELPTTHKESTPEDNQAIN